MTKHKVVIKDSNSFHHKFDDGREIGGSYGEPVTLTMWLDNLEYNFLKREIKKEHRAPDMAIIGMMASLNISDWHKRQIRKNFKVFTNVNIEL